MPSLPEPKDATRNKINEAKYFLWQVENRRDAYLNGQGDNELCLHLFQYFFSAFLCSARSILDYMKMQFKLNGTLAYRKFDDGYMQKDGKFKELRFFSNIRVENIHYKFGNKEPYKVKQRDQVNSHIGAYMLLEKSDESKSASTQLSQESMQDLEISTQESLAPQRVPIELLFLKQQGFLDRDTEVIEFCTRQLNTMIGLVELCEKGIFTVEELNTFTLLS